MAMKSIDVSRHTSVQSTLKRSVSFLGVGPWELGATSNPIWGYLHPPSCIRMRERAPPYLWHPVPPPWFRQTNVTHQWRIQGGGAIARPLFHEERQPTTNESAAKMKS